MNKKQKLILIRIIIAALLLIGCLFIPVDGWIRLIIFLVPYLLIGYDVLFNAVRGIFNGSFLDENFLMVVASIGAFVIGEYPEAVAVILFYQIGNLFELYSVGKSRKSIADLMDIRPDSATVIRNSERVTVDPEEVEIGEIIQVNPGEKVSLDGIIIRGESSINNVALTGESLPLDVTTGDEVHSGSINISGSILVKVTKVYSESTASKILELVENASSKKSTSEKFITKFAKYYTPIVVGLALLLFLIPSLITGNWGDWLHRALIFLVVSCPCALVISVPLTFFSGIGTASKMGILVKGSNYFETISKLDTIVFDKTGTLTEGVFEITEISPVDITEDELLYYAAKAESRSNHPIAQSISKAYGKDIEFNSSESFEELPGKGIKAVFEDHEVYVGNKNLLSSLNISVPENNVIGTRIYVSLDNRYVGYIVLNDRIKDNTKEIISGIRSEGINDVVLLSGDHSDIVNDVAEKLDINIAKAELLPEDKVQAVQTFISSGKKVGFVGDGINDAPVLAVSDIGFAMGALGSAAAIEAADVVIMDDNLSKVVVTKKIASRVLKIVKQNIVFSLVIKFLVLILGAIGIANMWIALFADVGVLILAILNSMRAMNSKAIK